MIYSDRQSLSFISISKGGLIKNPDGTLQISKSSKQFQKINAETYAIKKNGKWLK